MATRKLLEVPRARNFVRRGYHSSILLNNHVYIDGGEITQKVNDTTVTAVQNTTLAIDMRASWTNESVSFRSIEKIGPPLLNGQVLLPKDGDSFFVFGGEQSHLPDPPGPPVERQLWQFSTASNLWTNVNPSPSSGSRNLTRPSRALSATLGDTGFVLGGIEDIFSNPALESEAVIPIPGIVTFNTTSGRWTDMNSSSIPSILKWTDGIDWTKSTLPFGVMWSSEHNRFLASLPSFGSIGLLLAAGTAPKAVGTTYFDKLMIYEPSSKTWHEQKATGDIPIGRDLSCVVGVQGDNGTYEVFMYGGVIHNFDGSQLLPVSAAQYAELDSVYVLSLPAFAWFKATYAPRRNRFLHTCHIVGRRQMLSIGGLDSNANNADEIADPITQGLEIFDLTEMTWSDHYDANAEPYKTPQIVRDWYSVNGTSTVHWNDSTVQDLFGKSVATHSIPSNSAAPSSTPSSPASLGSKQARIIAGTVVGGIVGISILLGVIFFFRRLRNARRDLQKREKKSWDSHELGSSRPPRPSIIHEIPDHGIPYEADSRARVEIDGRYMRELDANGLDAEDIPAILDLYADVGGTER